jgi:hypothetical protein
MITLKARTSIHNSPCVCMLTACPGYKFEREAICVACVLPVQESIFQYELIHEVFVSNLRIQTARKITE